jgi:hypothetical protein
MVADGTAVVVLDLGIDQRPAMRPQLRERALLLDPDQPAVADHVRRQDGCQLAVDVSEQEMGIAQILQWDRQIGAARVEAERLSRSGTASSGRPKKFSIMPIRRMSRALLRLSEIAVP